eukprot:9400289-Alexandrium_andersonii.AAC.1
MRLVRCPCDCVAAAQLRLLLQRLRACLLTRGQQTLTFHAVSAEVARAPQKCARALVAFLVRARSPLFACH